jgi:NhaP-type Na+/H+ or K+/H+ antiporter
MDEMILPALLFGLAAGLVIGWLTIQLRNWLLDIDNKKGQPQRADLEEM